MELKGSRTEANLMAAYVGESQARTKYNLYASAARQEGYEQIAAIFDETAHNEKEHAEIWLKYLKGGNLGATVKNLEDAAGGEHFEWSEMYKEFADVAQQEGFEDIAASMRLIAGIEKQHELRYRKLINNLKENIVFHSGQETLWICRNCGYIHSSKDAPMQCPVCKHPRSFFERKPDNY